MEKLRFSPSSPTVVEGKSAQTPVINGNTLELDRIVDSLPLSKDGQEPTFENVLEKAYGNFPKLKMHADLHSSEYKSIISLINGLPTQLQNKWRLLRLCLWNQYGSSVFGEIFNLPPDKTRKETAFLSDLPDELINMVSELLGEGDDEGAEDEEETAENVIKRKGFVILAEGGPKWNALTPKQRTVLEKRYLANRLETHATIAIQLKISRQGITHTEKQGLRRLGFFGEFHPRIGRLPTSPSPKELEFIKTNYPNNSVKELSRLTGHSSRTITRWLREAGVTIRKKGERGRAKH